MFLTIPSFKIAMLARLPISNFLSHFSIPVLEKHDLTTKFSSSPLHTIHTLMLTYTYLKVAGSTVMECAGNVHIRLLAAYACGVCIQQCQCICIFDANS